MPSQEPGTSSRPASLQLAPTAVTGYLGRHELEEVTGAPERLPGRRVRVTLEIFRGA